jgi:phosphate transport system substrate-binding protein
LARAFEAAHPGVTVKLTGGGSTKGLRDVLNGAADIGGAARRLTPAEAASVMAVPWAVAGVAIVANRELAMEAVSLAELRRLYAEPRGSASVPFRISKSHVHGTFQAVAEGLGLPEAALTGDFIAGSNGEVLAAVAAHRRGLGYVSFGDAEQAVKAGAPLRILALEGVLPTLATIRSGQYPLRHPLYLCLGRSPTQWTLLFMAMVRGERGQAALQTAGMVPPSNGGTP